MSRYSEEIWKRSLLSEYRKLQPLYANLINEIESLLLRTLEKKKITVHSIQSRVKSFESFYHKLLIQGITEKPFENVSDVAGIRIICLYARDLEEIKAAIREKLDILEADTIANSWKNIQSDLRAVHFLARLPKDARGVKYEAIRKLKCEIQIQTILMYAWDSAVYDIYYKQGVDTQHELYKTIEKELDLCRRIVGTPRLKSFFVQDLDKHQSVIEIYKSLMSASAEESKFQGFFEKYPGLLDPRVTRAFPRKSFAGENVPDFVLSLNDEGYILVELEKPSVRLYTKRGDPTAQLSHSEEQIRGYLKWAKEEKEFLRKRGLKNLNVENTTGLVVIGANLTLNEKHKLESHNANVRTGYTIKTFDRILEEYQFILANFAKFSRP
jgi:ppGpp synthetase/RelA/SpoT-type nucleotidyltranferase